MPYQLKVVYIPGKVLGVVDYLSREPSGDSWPECELYEKWERRKPLDCLSSRLIENIALNQKENIPEFSRTSKREKDKTRHLAVAIATKRFKTSHTSTGLKTTLVCHLQNAKKKILFWLKLKLSIEECRCQETQQKKKTEKKKARCIVEIGTAKRVGRETVEKKDYQTQDDALQRTREENRTKYRRHFIDSER